jgi:hypothetical protein
MHLIEHEVTKLVYVPTGTLAVGLDRLWAIPDRGASARKLCTGTGRHNRLTVIGRRRRLNMTVVRREPMRM